MRLGIRHLFQRGVGGSEKEKLAELKKNIYDIFSIINLKKSETANELPAQILTYELPDLILTKEFIAIL